MNIVEKIIKKALQEKMSCKRVENITLSPRCVLNQCYIYGTDSGNFFVKVNNEDAFSMFEAEAKGLQSLKNTQTVRVPTPYYWAEEEGYSFLIMEHLQLSAHTPSSQKELGTLLAKMHLAKGAKKFGYDINNTIGTTPQINTWSENWVEFFIHQRLVVQLKLLEQKRGDTEILSRGEKFIERYTTYFKGIQITPALLHGDLWSGNTAADEKGKPVIYDPAVYYGHDEAEFGILLMFGGFTQEFHEAYRELIPMEPGFQERQLGYQLYHYLNHYNIFGSSYRPSCMSILAKL